MILVASCPDEVGIVRAVSNFVFDAGAGIVRFDQFSEGDTERFFMRCEFRGVSEDLPKIDELRDSFVSIGEKFRMDWEVHDGSVKPRVLIAVSKFGHCLNDLLFRWRNDDLSAEIAGIISNHPDMRSTVQWYGLPFHHLPVSNDNRQEQEHAIAQLIEDECVDLLVLARYMQVLSESLCLKLAGRAINIHHSFLPSFKGAKPYHQAHDRGVKLIGATAHYVTSDLDEGPIIEQDIQRVTHANSSDEFVGVGRDVESRVLARAVKWHCEHRVLVSGHKTIVFS